MELQKLNGYGAEAILEPVDCAALAEICRRAEDSLMSEDDGQLLNQARTYGATFQALAVATMTPNILRPADKKEMAAELAALGLSDLVNLGPTPKEQR